MLTNCHVGFNISIYVADYDREVVIVIFEKLRTLIAEQFAVNENTITMETSFVGDLGADSLDVVELTMAIEEEFYIPEVDEDTVNSLITVGDVVRFLSENID